MTEHPVTTWRERALKAEETLAGVKSQALEWKRTLDEVTSSDWHQRQHEIEAEIERLKRNQCPGLEEHDAYAHMHTRALRAEAEVERQQTTIRDQAESIRLLYVVYLASREFLEFIEAWDTIDPQYRDNLRRALDACKTSTDK